MADLLTSLVRHGDLDQVYIKGKQGYVLVMPVGEEALLIVLVAPEAKLGLIFLDLGRFAKLLLRDGDSDNGEDDPRLPEPILPRRPPRRRTARAKPDYD